MAVDKLVDSTQLDADLTSVANAIRTKGGTSSQLAFPAGFVSAVQAIPTGTTPTLITKTITQNGTYDAEDDNADGYSEVTVSVSGRDLPDDYYELAFVDTNSGNAYLDTNYTPVQGDLVRLTFSSNQWGTGPILSAGTGTYQFIILTYSSGNPLIYVRNFSSSSASLGGNLKANAWYNVQSDANGLFTLSGDASATVTSTYGGAVNTTLRVGRRADDTTKLNGRLGRIVIENNSVLKLSLIPAQRKSDDAVGFYNTVTETFMQSSSQTAFKPGPIVLTDSEALEILLGGE